METILYVVLGNILYQGILLAALTAVTYRRQKKAKKLQAKYKAELEKQGIRILETKEDVENYMKLLNKEHLQVVKSDEDDSRDPRNNN